MGTFARVYDQPMWKTRQKNGKFPSLGQKWDGRQEKKIWSPIFNFYSLISPCGQNMSIELKPEVSNVIWWS